MPGAIPAAWPWDKKEGLSHTVLPGSLFWAWLLSEERLGPGLGYFGTHHMVWMETGLKIRL